MFVAADVHLKHAVQQLVALSDSAMVRGAADSAHPVLIRAVDSIRLATGPSSPLFVRSIEGQKSTFERIVTDPGFTWAWSLLTAVAAFFIGKFVERWDSDTMLKHEQWTSARLTRRYLLLGAAQIRDLIDRATNPARDIAMAHIEDVMATIGDFEAIKTRMISLENDELEEAIFQWNLL